MNFLQRFKTLNHTQRVPALVFLLQGLTLASRDLLSGKTVEIHSFQLKAQAFAEASHRVLEEIVHYINATGFQRPEHTLFQILDDLGKAAGIGSEIDWAYKYAEKMYPSCGWVGGQFTPGPVTKV